MNDREFQQIVLSRLEGIERRLDGLDKRLDGFEKEQDALIGHVSAVRTELVRLREERVKGLERELAVANDSFEVMTQRLGPDR